MFDRALPFEQYSINRLFDQVRTKAEAQWFLNIFHANYVSQSHIIILRTATSGNLYDQRHRLSTTRGRVSDRAKGAGYVMTGPYEISEYQLKKVGVILLSAKPLTLKCCKCEAVWPVITKGLRLPKGYWRCPKGCNVVNDA
jgi:hypothetical protein